MTPTIIKHKPLKMAELTKGVPRGSWVAVSSDKSHVVTHGEDMRAVIREAKSKGEDQPIVFRVPKSSATLVI